MKPIYLYPNQDFKNSIDTALEDGIAIGEIRGEIKGEIKGQIKEQIKIAKGMIKKGFEAALIAELTGLTINEIEVLENE
jgi:predicted transposase YdaD